MTPEEVFNKQVQEILHDLQEELLATPSGKPVKYDIPNIIGVGIIPKERKINIVHKLEEWGAIKIRDNPWEPYPSTEYYLYLDIHEPKFHELYEKYSDNKKSKSQSASNELGSSQSNEKYIEEWLSEKSDWFIGKLWPIVVELQAEYELRGKNVFKIPRYRFKKKNLDSQDVRSLLVQLDGNQIVSVVKITGRAPDNSILIGISISDNDDIYNDYETEITLTHKFKYLYQQLKLKLKSKKNIDSPQANSDRIITIPNDTSEKNNHGETKPMHGWTLEEDDTKAYIKHNGEVKYEFDSKETLKYKYLRYLWDHPQVHINYRDMQNIYLLKNEASTEKEYKYGDKIRRSLNTTKEELVSKHIPFEFVFDRGVTFSIRNS